MAQHVIVREYNMNYPLMFEKEKELLIKILKNNCEFGIKGRSYLRKGRDERTHQIHIFKDDDKYNLIRHLAVRDYLRTHDDVAFKYGKLKEELAKLFHYDIEKYCDGKDKFVKNMEKLALNWYKENGEQSI